MEFREEFFDDQCSDIIESSVISVRQRKIKFKNICRNRRPLVGDLLHESSLPHLSKLLLDSEPLQQLPFSMPTPVIKVKPPETAHRNHSIKTPSVMSELSDLPLQLQPAPTPSVFEIEQHYSRPSPLYELTSSDNSSNLDLPSQLDAEYLENTHNEKLSQSSNNHLASIQEQLVSQNVHQKYFFEQNANILKEVRKLESSVKEKMERIESLLKRLNTQRRSERKNIRRHSRVVGASRQVSTALPKLPISKLDQLILFNNSLMNSDFMDEFVLQFSQSVKIFEYNLGKSIYSIVSKIFTLNLIVKYSWMGSTCVPGTIPFSSLAGLLRAINQLLCRYFSGVQIENELKKFLKQIPRIYQKAFNKKISEKSR